jgi:hypothetical protein
MKAKEFYLHLAEVCERAAATAPLPETKVGMLASAAVWRRLVADLRSREAETLTAAKDNGRRTSAMDA